MTSLDIDAEQRAIEVLLAHKYDDNYKRCECGLGLHRRAADALTWTGWCEHVSKMLLACGVGYVDPELLMERLVGQYQRGFEEGVRTQHVGVRLEEMSIVKED